MASDGELESAQLLADSQELPKIKEQIPFPSCRLVMSIVAFLGFVNVYALRVNLSVGMVAMVNSSYQTQKNESVDACPVEEPTNSTVQHTSGEFNWDGNLQGLVLGSFFYGYILTQIPGGYLAERVGGKWLFGLGVLCTSVLTLLTPVAARLNVYLFIVLRALEGLGEGVTFPAMCAMLAKWAPPYERSKLGTFIYSGAQFGTTFSLPLSGLLAAHGPFGGWPSVFYIFGALGCLWFVLWTVLCHSSPENHPRISEAERVYIEEAIGLEKEEMTGPFPIRSVLLSTPFWAVLIVHTCNNWGFYTLLTNMPTYLKEILKFDLSQNGLVSAIPYLAQGILMAGGGQVADYLRFKHILSTTNVRKLANLIGLGTPAVTLAVIGYAGCNKVVIIILLTIAVGVGGISQSGYGVNHLDLAPPFAGTLFGITNAAATIPGFLAPQVVGIVTNVNPTRQRWQIVFWISSAIYCFGLIVYLIFGTGREQPWSRPEASKMAVIDTNDMRHRIQQNDTESEEDPVLTFARPHYGSLSQ